MYDMKIISHLRHIYHEKKTIENLNTIFHIWISFQWKYNINMHYLFPYIKTMFLPNDTVRHLFQGVQNFTNRAKKQCVLQNNIGCVYCQIFLIIHHTLLSFNGRSVFTELQIQLPFCLFMVFPPLFNSGAILISGITLCDIN